ncbi:hypothetical protein P3C80_29700 [Pseudomonas aeruginosa]|uniref:hypothetical protein n=1 Tax=Pseudomonas aeruginosa TaxID=287 RepID=UPI0021F17654|nr:hypothetical protein [Pseudomonas aeruginosa]MCV6104987.1 hypothetical protein [Pseudomonas aeruginosa]MDI2199634.1 hypothetical protein [Pseudomonas aeruginosa]MDY1161380.1 hypothetical protein [Pseudomonas aeruginosa]
MSSTQHQLIEQCATRLRGIVDALDNIHDTSPHRWSTDLDDVHSSAESLLALINDQTPPSDAERWKEQFDCMQLQRDHHRERADAALARVAELEAKLSDPTAVHQWQFSNAWFDGSEDVVLKASKEGSPIRTLYTAPAQAQHSVPEGWMLVECGIWTQEQVDEMQKTVARFRNSEFVDDRALAMAVADAGQCKAPEISLAELLAAAPGTEVPQAWLDVQAERRRQVEAEGWTPEHDDAHSYGQMARAAACYALAGSSAPNDGTAALLVSLAWPWDEQWWKPSTARRDMVKACALALAEIERLDRAGISQNPQPGATTASS